MIIKDTSRTEIAFSIFKTLLPPSEISPILVEFFCRLYNKKSIPGRRAFAASEDLLRTQMNKATTFARFLDSLVTRPGSPSCELLVCPLQLTCATMAFLVRRSTSSVKVLNWMYEDEGLAGEIEGVFEVCGTLHAGFILSVVC